MLPPTKASARRTVSSLWAKSLSCSLERLLLPPPLLVAEAVFKEGWGSEGGGGGGGGCSILKDFCAASEEEI